MGTLVGGAPRETIYNLEAAELLANEAQHLPILEATPIYEKLVSTFPTSAKYWKLYVDAFMRVNNYEEVKQIFNRCLLNCLHISLWRSYILFIRKTNEKKAPVGLQEITEAFDFMLNKIGNDIASGPVWMEYIAFLKSKPASSPQEESQRMASVRQLYQKAILIPMHHLDQLWRDYEIFEKSVSQTLAKGLLSEYRPKYNSAKAVYREHKQLTDNIDWNMLAVPPTGSSKEEVQCTAWKRLFAFEKGNPQKIDAASANTRVNFTYEQGIMYLFHYPEIWYDYAMWQSKSSPSESSINIFERALKALPDSDILKYAYAELEESRGDMPSAKKIYERLLSENNNATSLAQIQFLRFLRRTEGIESARKYFVEAHNSPTCTYQMFVAFAMMTSCLDKDSKVAQNVFETGLKRFMNEPAYILEYADFLCRLNDDRNVRALFERALSSLPPAKSIDVWNRFVQFEQTHGDLSSMLKVEKRRKEALSEAKNEDGSSSGLENNLYDVVSRYSFLDFCPCSSKDLDHLSRQEWVADIRNKRAAEKTNLLEFHGAPNFNVSNLGGIPGSTKSAETDEFLRLCSPSLQAFIANLPPVEGVVPDVDLVLSILSQSSIPASRAASSSTRQGKRNDRNWQEEDQLRRMQSRPMPKDIYQLRQIKQPQRHLSVASSGSAASAQSAQSVLSVDLSFGSTE